MTISTACRLTGLTLAIIALLVSPAAAQQSSDTVGQPPAIDHGIAGDDLDDETAFDHMVRGIDVLPDRQAMEQRWPDAMQRLIETAKDDDATTYKRWRATSLLGNFVEPEVEQALVELSDDAEPRVRAMAYYVLGGAFLNDGDTTLFEHLEAGLQDSEHRVRADVVRSLGWTDHARAHELLETIAAGEHHEELQSIAARSLQRLGR